MAHCYARVVIQGGHTGSAYRYHSGVFTSVEELVEELSFEFLDEQSGSFMLLESPEFFIELYREGERIQREPLFPRCTLVLVDSAGAKRRLCFDADGSIVGDVITEEDLLGCGERLPESEVEIDTRGLAEHLPARDGPRLARYAFVGDDGDPRTQAHGWVGHFFEGRAVQRSRDGRASKPRASKRGLRGRVEGLLEAAGPQAPIDALELLAGPSVSAFEAEQILGQLRGAFPAYEAELCFAFADALLGARMTGDERVDLAIAELDHVVELHPRSAAAHLALARALLRARPSREVLARWERAAECVETARRFGARREPLRLPAGLATSYEVRETELDQLLADLERKAARLRRRMGR